MPVLHRERKRNRNFRDLRASGEWRPKVCDEGQRLISEARAEVESADELLREILVLPSGSDRALALVAFRDALGARVAGHLADVGEYDDGTCVPATYEVIGWACLDEVMRSKLASAQKLLELQRRAETAVAANFAGGDRAHESHYENNRRYAHDRFRNGRAAGPRPTLVRSSEPRPAPA